MVEKEIQMVKWGSGATFLSNGEYKSLISGFIELQQKDQDVFLLSFVSDINNRFIAKLTKEECQELSEKLKDITKS